MKKTNKLLSMRIRALFNFALTVSALVLFMSWLRIRPLGVLILTFLGFWIYWTQCNFRIVPPVEFQEKFVQLKRLIINCRVTRPTMFCAVTSGCLGAIAILGQLVSGSTVVLAGCILAGIVSRKCNFKLVKIELKDFAWAERQHHAGNEFDEEFFPDVNETNFFILERASNSATIYSTNDDEEKNDEIPSELLIRDVIPEINEQSSDDDNDDLVQLPLSVVQSYDLSTLATGTTTDVMKFHKGHFKRDSSLSTTSSEESLSKGLEFPDHTAIDGPSLQQVLSGGNINAILSSPTLLLHNHEATNIVAMAMKTPAQDLITKNGILLPSIISELIHCGREGIGSRNDDNNDIISSNKINETLAVTNAAPCNTSLGLVVRRMITGFDSSDESDFEILETDDFK